MRSIAIYLIAALVAVSCGGRATQVATTAPSPKTAGATMMFPLVMPPATMNDSERLEYVRYHFWDRFDFGDTTLLRRIGTEEMLKAYVSFVQILFSDPLDGVPMDSLMARTRASRRMMDYFVDLASKVLHDPNSPLRNDEFYIPVLRAQLAAPWYDQYERLAPEYDLEMASKNRVGHLSNDFRYTLASGKSARLHALNADFVLMMINNPGCPMCRDIREAITASPLLQELISDGRLKVLALYPDEDLAEWYAYRDKIPQTWINAYDKGCCINAERLYDLTAIPSLYLLDSRKRVLVKDSTSVPQIEEAIRRGL